MANESFDDVCANIRACLNSSKDQISLTALNRDYSSIIGSNIPYRKLGFNTLEDLARAVPNIRLNKIGNDIYIDVKPDQKTAHITNLVRGQKPSKKKSKSRYGRAPPRRNFNNYSNNNKSSYNNYSSKKQHQSNYDNDRKDDPNYIFHKYRSTVPSHYDFSDEEEEFNDFEYDEYDSSLSDEIGSVTKNEPEKMLNDFKNLHITVDNNRLGSGRSNMKLRGGLRMSNRSYPYRTNSQEDDIGYSSMAKDYNGSSTVAETEEADWDDSIPGQQFKMNNEDMRSNGNSHKLSMESFEEVNDTMKSRRLTNGRRFTGWRPVQPLSSESRNTSNYKGRKSMVCYMNNLLAEDNENYKVIRVTIKNGNKIVEFK